MFRACIRVAAFAALLSACKDSTAPAPIATSPISVKLCGYSAPAWFAYQNEGGKWTRVTGSGGTFAFEATPKVAIAYADAWQFGSDIAVLQMTAQQLAALSCADEQAGVKGASGTVQGLGANAFAVIRLGQAYGFASTDFPNYDLYGFQSGALDLVASRTAVQTESVEQDRVVIRRGLDVANASAIPVIDFASAEAFAPASASIQIAGASASNFFYLTNAFHTATGTQLDLHTGTVINGSGVVNEIPVAQTTATDRHALTASTWDSFTGREKGVVHYYRAGGNKTISFGADIATPSITTVATSPNQRVRAVLPSQADYGDFAILEVFQSAGSNRSFTVVTTKEYSGGTPATWDLTMPDLSGAAGFQTSWGLVSGPYDWQVQVMQVPLTELMGNQLPPDGSTFRQAAARSPYATSAQRDRGCSTASAGCQRHGFQPPAFVQRFNASLAVKSARD